MKYSYVLQALIALFIITFLTACTGFSSGGDQTELIKHLKDPSVKDVNRSIQIKLDTGSSNQFESGGTIRLVIVNQSRKSIKFPPGSNVQIFLFDDETNNWMDIANSVEYYGDETIIVPNGAGPDAKTLLISPVFKSNEKEQQMRVAVTGYVVKDGQTTDEAVSAFIDFKGKP